MQQQQQPSMFGQFGGLEGIFGIIAPILAGAVAIAVIHKTL
jgi:hypothetical protein